jgi:hypothetical protein
VIEGRRGIRWRLKLRNLGMTGERAAAGRRNGRPEG